VTPHARNVTALCVGASLLFEIVFCMIGSLVPDTLGQFGAPLPAGRSNGLLGSLVSLGAVVELWPLPFAIDVALVAALFWLAYGLAGAGGPIAMLAGSFVGLFGTAVLYGRPRAGIDLPLGFPWPIAPMTLSGVDQLALFGDSLFGGAIALGLWIGVRRIVRRPPASAAPDRIV